MRRAGGSLNVPLRTQALRLLSRREHSRAELARKLTAAGKASDAADTGDELAALLDSLEAAGLLSDTRYAASRMHVRGTRIGDARLMNELRQQGVAAETIAAALEQMPDEAVRARAVWSRRFGVAPADSKEWAKQARFLQSRGFSVSTIRQLLGSLDDEST